MAVNLHPSIVNRGIQAHLDGTAPPPDKRPEKKDSKLKKIVMVILGLAILGAVVYSVV